MLALLVHVASAAERPTFNKNTCDPRPDILPYWLHDWYQDYRSLYNRPRYLPGKIAHMIEPSSQEAMVWHESKQMGLYQGKNCPPAYKRYFYARPWQILQTGPRSDFTKPNQLGPEMVPQSASTPNTVPGSEISPADQSVPQTTRNESGLITVEQFSRNPEPNSSGKASSLVRPAQEFRFK